MIIVIDALNKDRFSDVLNDMFRLRVRVFGDRLGWEVDIQNGMEIDQFDRMDPAYVIGLDDDGNVISCARALQTTGPHMLSDVFYAILDGEPPLRSPNIWESTRFCFDTQRLKGGSANTVSNATCELMIAMLEYARNSGITDIITVIDPIMDRVLKRSDNAPYDYVGKRTAMGKVDALAALLDCSNERISRVRAFAGITGDVFVSEEAARAMQDAKAIVPARASNVIPFAPVDTAEPQVTQDHVMEYCSHQIASAETQQDLEAALALAAVLASRVPRHRPAVPVVVNLH